MNFLFLFLDGVGLGADNPEINPFSRAPMPRLRALLGGQPLVASTAPNKGKRASLLPLDACLGVPGLPQSATGQAVLLTGINIPRAIGYHYGPKPNPAVAEYLRNGSLFNSVQKIGQSAAFLNAYPPRYFEAVKTGYRIYSSIPLAAVSAGIPLRTMDDLVTGQALSADFTGEGWRARLSLPDTPVMNSYEAGVRLAELAQGYNFSFFEYWLSDYAGHGQEMEPACQLLETFDQVLGGLLDAWEDEQGLALITSDHGNLEDLSTRRHTSNPVPALVIGAPRLRENFINSLRDLSHVSPAIIQFLRYHSRHAQ